MILLPVRPLSGPIMREFTPAIGAMFAFQVIVVVAFGFLMWFRVLAIYPASDMASFGSRASSDQVESPDRIKMLDFKVLEQL
jgi:hypothetical protein